MMNFWKNLDYKKRGGAVASLIYIVFCLVSILAFFNNLTFPIIRTFASNFLEILVKIDILPEFFLWLSLCPDPGTIFRELSCSREIWITNTILNIFLIGIIAYYIGYLISWILGRIIKKKQVINL